MKIALLLSTILLLSVSLLAAEPPDLEKYRAASEKKWAEAMADLDALNATEKHPADSVLFIGSSSIRRWDTISDDLIPYHAIRRGFGGCRWSDVALYADRLITPHQFRAVVFFVGNDISGSKVDKTPEEVAALFAHVHARVRAHNPDAAIFYIAVTPTPKRWPAWPQIKKANSAARAVCAKEKNTSFIGTESLFLDGDGKPRPELFAEDQLHLNPAGYLLWTAAIKSHLDTTLNGAK